MLVVLSVPIAGCGAGYRDTNVPIGTTTRFDAERFGGDWQLVARFGDQPVGPMRFDPGPGVLTDLGTSQNRALNTADGLAVMWVDQDYRTAALGTWNGQVGFILDRSDRSAPDRLRAARQIMEFYGWDVSRLAPPPQAAHRTDLDGDTGG